MRNEKTARLSLYLLYLAYGMTITLISPFVQEIANEFSLSGTEAGLINTINYIGGIVAIVLLLFITSKIRKGMIFVVGAGVLAVCMYLTSSASAYVPLLVIMFVLGIGMKIVDSLGTSILTDRYQEDINKKVNTLHMCFSIGAFVAPIIVGIVKDACGFTWHDSYILFAIIITACFAFFLASWRNTGITDASAGSVDITQRKKLLRSPDLWIMFTLLFLYCFHQNGITYWTATYFGTKDVPVLVADFSASALWIGVICSRLVVARSKNDIGIPMTVWGSLIGGVLITTAILLDQAYFLLVAYFVAGLLVGAVIPVFLVKITSQFPAVTGIAATILTLGFVIGSSVTTLVMGSIADSAGMMMSMIIGGGIPLLIMFIIGIIYFRGRAMFKKSE